MVDFDFLAIFVFLQGCRGKLCWEVFARIVRVVGSRLPSLRLCNLCLEGIEWEQARVGKSWAVLLAMFLLVNVWRKRFETFE